MLKNKKVIGISPLFRKFCQNYDFLKPIIKFNDESITINLTIDFHILLNDIKKRNNDKISRTRIIIKLVKDFLDNNDFTIFFSASELIRTSIYYYCFKTKEFQKKNKKEKNLKNKKNNKNIIIQIDDKKYKMKGIA